MSLYPQTSKQWSILFFICFSLVTFTYLYSESSGTNTLEQFKFYRFSYTYQHKLPHADDKNQMQILLLTYMRSGQTGDSKYLINSTSNINMATSIFKQQKCF